METYAENGKNTLNNNIGEVQAEKLYRVQVMASMEKLSASENVFSSYPQIQYILCPGQIYKYKYTLGDFKSFEEAQEYCIKLRSGHFPDAFVIAVKDGQLVPVN